MNEAEPTDPAREGIVEKIDALMKRLSERRKESIRRSLERTLKIELLRTGYLVGCILLDMILLPIAVIETMGHDLLFVSVVILIPLIYLEYRIYQRLFQSPH